MLKFSATRQDVSCSTTSVCRHLERARPEKVGSRGSGSQGDRQGQVGRGPGDRRGPGGVGVLEGGHRGQLDAGHNPALPECPQPHLGFSALGIQAADPLGPWASFCLCKTLPSSRKDALQGWGS